MKYFILIMEVVGEVIIVLGIAYFISRLLKIREYQQEKEKEYSNNKKFK